MVNWDDAVDADTLERSRDKRYWTEMFTSRPDVMFAMLGDLYTITKAHERPDVRGGRRARVSGDLDELWDMLTPQFSLKPFGDALREVMGDSSLRQFAAAIPMHHRSLARLMDGERQIVNLHDPKGSMAQLERIATVAGVHPSYFAEWRRLWIFSRLDDVFEAHPNTSIGLIKKYAGVS